jgi:hypothetical protein
MHIYVISKLVHDAKNEARWMRRGEGELDGRMHQNCVYERYIRIHRARLPERDIVDLWKRQNSDKIESLNRMAIRKESAPDHTIEHINAVLSNNATGHKTLDFVFKA